MSIEIEGVVFTPDYKAKERKLYQIISSRDNELAALRLEIAQRDEKIGHLRSEIDVLKGKILKLRTELTRRREKRGENAPD